MKNKSAKYNLIIFLLIIIGFNKSYSQNFWQPTNGPQGGNYRFIKTNQVSDYTYLSTYWNTNHGNGLGGNLFRSPDGGMNWTEIDAGLFALGIGSLSFNSVNTNLAIVTSPASPTAQCFVYTSPDNGGTWNIVNASTFSGTNTSAGILYNSTADTLYAGRKTFGVVYSTTGTSPIGTVWSTMSTGLTNLNSTDLEYGYQGRLYTCTDSLSPANGGKVFVKNGTTWTNFSTGLSNARINDLYYHAATSTLYLGTANISSGTGKIYKSVNGGTWTLVPGYTGTQVQKITTTNSGDLIISAVNQGVWRYSAGVWNLINTNLSSTNVSSIEPDYLGNILCATKAGIWKLNDVTNTWSYFTNGIKNSQGRSLAFSQNGDIVVGTDNGMYHSPDGGTTWSHTGLTDTAMMSTILYPQDGRMFAGNTDPTLTASHIFTSNDNGLSWSINETGFSSTRTADFAINSTGKIFVGTGWSSSVHSSSDGINWNGPSATALGFLPSSLALSIAIDSSDVIFAGMEDDGVYRSIDGGVSYNYMGLAVTLSNISDVKISPNQDVFVTQTPFTGSPNGSIFRSTDGGNTWGASTMSTHGQPNCIYISSPDSIFVGTTKGVWISTDTANTWTLLNTGLNPGNLAIQTLELSPDGYLYAGTSGAGIYRSVNKIKNIVTTSIGENSNTINQLKVYPNPTDGFLSFSATIFDIEIYNVLGELVYSNKGATNSISTENYSNGIYFLKSNLGVTRFVVSHK